MRRFSVLLITLSWWSSMPSVVHAAVPGDPLQALVQFLASASDDAVVMDMLRGMKAGLVGRRQVAMPEGWSQLESRWTQNTNAELRLLVQSLGLTFGSESALNSLRSLLRNSTASIVERRGALDGLVSVKDLQLPMLIRGLFNDPAIRASAIRALAGFEDPTTPGALLEIYPKLALNEKREALNVLASRITFAKPLVEAIRSRGVPASDLTADLVRQLRSLKDPGVASDMEKLWGVTREASQDQKKEIDRYRKIYALGGSTPGDASRGRKVFARICQQCHTLFDTGGKVGPDLSGSNRGDLEYILSNIVDPNAVIPNDYRSSTIETKDDRVLTGIVRQQDEKTVTVTTATETLVLPRSEVKSVQLSELSMMPEGLMTALSDVEVRDLIYYLGRPGQVP